MLFLLILRRKIKKNGGNFIDLKCIFDRIRMIRNVKKTLLMFSTLFAIFSLTVEDVDAQSCYQIGLDEGRNMYSEALRLQNSNRCDEAAQQFWAALRRFRLTRRCADLPANHELDSWEDRCINGITGCGYIPGNENIVRQELRVTPQTINVDEKGGETLVNVTTNVADWLVSQSPAWITVGRQSANRLSVRYSENAETNIREGVVIITANDLQARITIRQAGMSCYEAGISQSRALFDEAQRLQSIGNTEEAAQHFLAAFRKVRETEENCTDIPADNQLEITRENISQTVSEIGFIIENERITPRTIRETLQPIVFPETGGEATLTLTGIADDWTITGYPAWSIARKEGAGLTVWCSENTEINGRQEEILITAGITQIIIPVVQEGNACYEAGMSESRRLFAEAQRLQSTGNRDEAAQYFHAAFRIVKETEENCRAIPEIHDLEIITEEIILGIEESGYVLTENQEIVRMVEPQDNPRYYVALSGGASSFGKISDAEVKNGAATVLRADIAYFLKSYLGLGVKTYAMFSTVNFEETTRYEERMYLVAPALYGRWGKGKMSLTASAGLGILNWLASAQRNEPSVSVSPVSVSSTSESALGGFFSLGMDYMFTKRFGIKLNVQTPVGSIKTSSLHSFDMSPNAQSSAVSSRIYSEVVERKLVAPGVSLGFNFRL